MNSSTAAVLLLTLLAAAGCSPDTDITETSTDPAGGRGPYSVVAKEAQQGHLVVRVRVNEAGSGERIARDLVMRELMRANAIDVIVLDGRRHDARLGKLSWSTATGFKYDDER